MASRIRIFGSGPLSDVAVVKNAFRRTTSVTRMEMFCMGYRYPSSCRDMLSNP